jgi:hypothetical protein
VPAEIRAQSADDGGGIASSVPAEIGVQTGHSGTWIARSVPAEIRARAQSAYKEAYTPAPLTLLPEPYPWRAEPVQGAAYVEPYTTPHGMGRTDESPYSQIFIEAYPRQIAAFFVELRSGHATPVQSAHTRAYRAYLGASPAAGDPTATPRAAGGCPCCCEVCWDSTYGELLLYFDCETGELSEFPPAHPCHFSLFVAGEGVPISFKRIGDGGGGAGGVPPPESEECCSGQSNDVVRDCEILCGETREYQVNASASVDCWSCWANWPAGPCGFSQCAYCNAYLNDFADQIRGGRLILDCPLYLCANVCP